MVEVAKAGLAVKPIVANAKPYRRLFYEFSFKNIQSITLDQSLYNTLRTTSLLVHKWPIIIFIGMCVNKTMPPPLQNITCALWCWLQWSLCATDSPPAAPLFLPLQLLWWLAVHPHVNCKKMKVFQSEFKFPLQLLLSLSQTLWYLLHTQTSSVRRKKDTRVIMEFLFYCDSLSIMRMRPSHNN